MEIYITPDLEDKHFKKNFFSGLDVRETVTAGAALAAGGSVYGVSRFFLGLPDELTIVLLLITALPILAVSFGIKDGYTPLERMQKQIYLMLRKELVYESTEEPEGGEYIEFYKEQTEKRGQAGDDPAAGAECEGSVAAP